VTQAPPQLHLTGQWTSPGRLLRELWAARELVVILGRRTFYVQYRRASLGALWAVGLPLFQAIVLAVVFARITRFDVPHYPVYVFSGMVAWSFFLGSVVPGATSIVDNAGLSSKVYFPRAVLPLSQLLASAYTLLTTGLVLILFAAANGVFPHPRIFLLLPGAALLVLLSGSFALVLSVMHVYLRDTRYIVQAASLGWLWITPVVFPLTSVHGWLRDVVLANPVTGAVQFFHAAFLPHVGHLWTAWITLSWSVVLLLAALFLHCRQDRVMADLL
jgi:ABC-type polysaccharide/polyol phosphate export permease